MQEPLRRPWKSGGNWLTGIGSELTTAVGQASPHDDCCTAVVGRSSLLHGRNAARLGIDNEIWAAMMRSGMDTSGDGCPSPDLGGFDGSPVGGAARARVTVVDVGFDPVTLDGALQAVCAFVEQWRTASRAASAAARPRVIITANPELVQVSHLDGELREALAGADLVLADGVGIVWAARVLGRPLPGRVAGADLVEALFEEGSRRGWRFFLLGGKPGVAEAAAANAVWRAPGIVVAGAAHGYFGPGEEEDVVRLVNETHADVLFVGLGAPRQEKWIWKNRERLSAGVCMGVGGTLDVLAGVVRRAPPVFRRFGLEWLYRLATQPWRYKRMMRLPVFAAEVLISRFWRGAGDSGR